MICEKENVVSQFLAINLYQCQKSLGYMSIPLPYVRIVSECSTAKYSSENPLYGHAGPIRIPEMHMPSGLHSWILIAYYKSET